MSFPLTVGYLTLGFSILKLLNAIPFLAGLSKVLSVDIGDYFIRRAPDYTQPLAEYNVCHYFSP